MKLRENRKSCMKVQRFKGWDFLGNPRKWLNLCLPMQGLQVQSLVEELRSHVPLGQKAKTENRSNIIEENNRMGKTRDLFRNIRDTKGTFHA